MIKQKGVINIPVIMIFLLVSGMVAIFITITSKPQKSSGKLQEQISSSSAEVIRESSRPTTSPKSSPTPAVNTTPFPKIDPYNQSSLKLESVSPSTASINNELTIKGQKFDQNQGKLLIYARESNLYSSLYEIEKWSDTEIIAKLKFVGGGQFYIKVETADGQRSNELALKVIGGQPYIASVSPTTFKKGSTITITGNDFGSSAGKVNFNSNSGYGNLLGYGVIGSWTDTQIIFTVPSSLEFKEYGLEVVTSDNRKSSYKYFNVVD